MGGLLEKTKQPMTITGKTTIEDWLDEEFLEITKHLVLAEEELNKN